MNLRKLIYNENGIDWPTALLLGLTVAVVGAILVVASTSTAAFGPYNPSWEGTGNFREVVETDPNVDGELIRDTSRYEAVPANDTAAFIIAPKESYDVEDTARVRRFVENGGTLIVLENFRTDTNAFLDAIGADARVDGRLILDERHYDSGPAMPLATGVRNHSRTAGVDQITLNYATAVEPNNATVLVETSDYAHLANSADTEFNNSSELASYPVATVENVGNGEVVVVGDPSIAINAMYGESDNAAFLQRQYANEKRVLFDYTHTSELPPIMGAVLTIRDLPVLQGLLGLLAVTTVAVGARWPLDPVLKAIRTRVSRRSVETPAAERPILSDEERATYLRERHPNWDEEHIQQIITAFNSFQLKQDGNEQDQ